MKTALNLLLCTVLLCSCSNGSNESAGPGFLQVGKQYQIAIPITSEPHSFERPGTLTVTILEHGNGPWYQISYEVLSVKDQSQEITKTLHQTWLNFDQVLFVNEGSDNHFPTLYEARSGE